MGAVRMTPREYLLGFVTTTLYVLHGSRDPKKYEEAQGRLQKEIDDMPFIKQLGDIEFPFFQEPEDYAVRILGESGGKLEVSVDLSESIAKIMAVLLVDGWGKTILNL